jgi:hypothetical protein
MSALFRNCREVTALVLAGEDRRLGALERLTVRLHMQICAACPKFERQVALMRHALPRWRAYRDGAE